MEEQRVEEDRFWIVCNPANVSVHAQYVAHPSVLDAAVEARRLAQKDPGKKFLVMEPVGGYIYTKESGEEEVQLK